MLLYADDTVIFAETSEGLQRNLDIFGTYCNQWKLSVNCAKSKIMIFKKRKMKNPPTFRLQGNYIEFVDFYLYLGVVFNYNGNFGKAREKLVNQARRSLFSIY